MRRTAVLFLVFCAAFAQEDPRARAQELERQAEKALDEGRRADAVKLLAEAAKLRAKAGARPAGARPEEPQPRLPGQAGERAATADIAIGELDAALGKGDAAAARQAARRARELLADWAADLKEREQRLAEKETPVDRRVAELERRVRELKEITDRR